MDLQLHGKTAIVTGAGTGIGLGIAKVLAEEGTRIVLVARREQVLQEAAAELREIAGAPDPIVLPFDLTAPEAGKAVAKAAQAAAGTIDILVNNAGISQPIGVDAPEEAWADTYALRVVATRHLMESLLPGMKERRFGRFINIGGSFELHGPINSSAVMNAARAVCSKGLANVVAKDGITINTIGPGIIDSEQIRRQFPTKEAMVEGIARFIPAGHFGTPRDLAVLVALLASPLGGYITGELICVDGGMRRFAF